MSQTLKSLKEKTLELVDEAREEEGSESADAYRHSLQDRLFATVISQVVPSHHAPKHTRNAIPPVAIGKKRKEPEFSVRLMAHNFRRFNARIGFFIPMKNNLSYLFSWQRPTATLSFLAVHTLVCLEPHLLPSLPFVGIVFGIMIPSFLALHPTPSNDPEVECSLYKLPQAPPAELEPAPEFSVEFWRNLAVLQNSTGKFADLYDTVNEDLLSLVNFSDEGVTSALFPVLLVLAFVATFGTSLMSWQISALVGGWFMTIVSHPGVKKVLVSLSDIQRLRNRLQTLQAKLRHWSQTEVVLRDTAEVRQVEIFELQRHHTASDTWEPWLFSPSPYEPLNPSRVTGTRAKGTQFFGDVRAPVGWVWKDARWRLDLFSREWVEQRMITGVEIETEGERWVYDFPPEHDPQPLDPAVAMRRRTSSVPKSGWQETAALQQRGEWRRRRWTRLVERKPAVRRTEQLRPE